MSVNTCRWQCSYIHGASISSMRCIRLRAESLIHLRLNLVATHILVVIHQKERFDDTVGNRMAMRTGIAYKAKHLLIFDGMRNDFHIINICLLLCRAYTMRKVVGTVKLYTQLVYHIAAVARHKQHIIYSTHFGIGELKGCDRLVKKGERRRCDTCRLA